ncbi:MAG: secretin N-terminal domain-containing protein [bacterium]|nr:secretin N-terminal domain-containing protein [bacterium]
MRIIVLFLMVAFVCTQPKISVFSQTEEPLEAPPLVSFEEAERTPPEVKKTPLKMPIRTSPKTSIKETDNISSSKITLLELKNMDILEAFKLLSKKSGVNIVASNSVKGKISIFLRNVEAWDVLRMIFETNNLAYEEKGDIIKVMTEREYETIHGRQFKDPREIKIYQLKYATATDVKKALDQMKTKIGRIVVDERTNTLIINDVINAESRLDEIIKELDSPYITKTFILEYTDPKEMEGKLKKIISSKGHIQIDQKAGKIILIDVPENVELAARVIEECDSRAATVTEVFELNYAKVEDIEAKLAKEVTKNIGSVIGDKATNKIIITDLPSNMGKLSEIIRAADARTREVLIEARIIQITLTDEYKMGVNWDYLFSKNKSAEIIGKFELAAKDSFSPGMTLSLGKLAVDKYTGFLQALNTIGKTNLLQSPRITVINNAEARIHVGETRPYVTTTVSQGSSTTETAESVTNVDVGVTLSVTPTINEHGFITMKIKPEVSSVSGTVTTSEGNTIPIVSKSETETTVMVKDGVTIVMAGLIKDELTDANSGIPFFRKIPIFGYLFGKIDKEIIKQEIVIFLTPHIVTGEYGLLTTAEKEAKDEIKHEDNILKLLDDAKKKELTIHEETEKHY